MIWKGSFYLPLWWVLPSQFTHNLEGEPLPAPLVSPSQLLLSLSVLYYPLLCEINCLNQLCLSVDQFILSKRGSQGNIDLLTLPLTTGGWGGGAQKAAVYLQHSCYNSLSLIPTQSGPSLGWPATSCATLGAWGNPPFLAPRMLGLQAWASSYSTVSLPRVWKTSFVLCIWYLNKPTMALSDLLIVSIAVVAKLKRR